MKNLKYNLGGGLLAGLLLVTAPAMASVTLSVQPSNQTVIPGQTFSVDIVVSGREGQGPNGEDEIVRTFDLLLGYDPTLLTATALTFGDKLNNGVLTQSLRSYTLNYNPATGGPPGPALPTGTAYSGAYSQAVEFRELSFLCYDNTDTCASAFQAGPYLEDIQAIPPDAFTLATITFQVSLTAPNGAFTTLQLMDDRFYSPNPGLFNAKGIARDTDLVLDLNNGNLDIPEPSTLALLLGVGLLSTGRRVLCRGKSPAVS